VAWRGFCTGAGTSADEVADEESDPAEDVEHAEHVAAACGSLAIGLLSAARLLLLNSMGSERASVFLPSGVVHACVRSVPSPVRGGPDRCSAAAHAGDDGQRVASKERLVLAAAGAQQSPAQKLCPRR
jgi:hypothetical protein